MKVDRLFNIIKISLMKNGDQRAKYLKKKNIFAKQGENCVWQPRNIPPESKLIKFGDNVVIASEVLFVNHDTIHLVFNNIDETYNYSLNLGAIEIGNNVWIGSRSIIFPNTLIEDNVIISGGSVVRGKILEGGVYAGVPAKRIGEFSDILTKRKTIDIDDRVKTERFDDTWKKFNERYYR